ncbi:MAG: protease modulator HflC [Dongiaceae bacterium]
MNRYNSAAIFVVVIVLFFVLLGAVFTVHQAEQALVLRWGQPVRVIENPGISFKIPMAETVEPISKKVLSVEGSQQELLTKDQKRIVVDYFGRYRIVNPLLFFQSVRNELTLDQRLQPIIASQMRRVLGNVALAKVLTKDRADLMRQITRAVDAEAKGFGIQVLDVRMKRVDLPPQNSEAIFGQMRTQREQEAALIRAEGARVKQTMQAEADKQRVVIVANARKQAEILRGQGDAEATATYNEAYGRDPAFFDFYRSMQALTNGLAGDTTTYVGPASGEFFRYFGTEGLPPAIPSESQAPSQ